jgi:hypothetical protein
VEQSSKLTEPEQESVKEAVQRIQKRHHDVVEKDRDTNDDKKDEEKERRIKRNAAQEGRHSDGSREESD